MGNRVALVKKSQRTSEVLFESNNHIPYFWFTLMDKEMLEKVIPLMIEQFNHEVNDTKPESVFSGIPISKPELVSNVQKNIVFIEKNIPERKVLYDAFVVYLQDQLEKEDWLVIDVLEMAHFDNAEQLIEDISEELDLLPDGDIQKSNYYIEGNVFCLTGNDLNMSNRFQSLSNEYKEHCKEDEIRRDLIKKQNEIQAKKTSVKKRIEGFVMLTVGSVLLMSSMLMFKEKKMEGGVCMLVFSILIIVYSVITMKRKIEL